MDTYLQLLEQVSTQRRLKQLFPILVRLYDLQFDLGRAGFLQYPNRGVGRGVRLLRRRGTVHEGGWRTGGGQV